MTGARRMGDAQPPEGGDAPAPKQGVPQGDLITPGVELYSPPMKMTGKMTGEMTGLSHDRRASERLVAVDARLTFRSRLIRTLQPLFGL